MASLKLEIILLALVAASLVAGSFASIENEPVKVTFRNSGPKYDIDEVERTKMTREEESTSAAGDQQQPPSPFSGLFRPFHSAQDGGEQPQIGHISIRRIFLVPVDSPRQEPGNLWSGAGSPFAEREQEQQERGQEASAQQPTQHGNLFPGAANPFFPFFHPPISRNGPQHHLFGADAASRSPTPDSSERTDISAAPATAIAEQRPQQPGQFIDPIQMMAEIMRQALGQAVAGAPMMPPTGDADADSPLSQKPVNASTEEIVEMDGRKYLRKTVINRQVGDHIIFMTKRLIFVPLNETDTIESTAAATTTTAAPTTPTELASTTSNTKEEAVTVVGNLPPAPSTIASNPEEPSITTTTASPVVREEATTTTTMTTTAAATSPREEATTVTTTTLDSSSTLSAKETWIHRVADAVNRAERLMEKELDSSSTTTTTQKPELQQQ